MADALETGNTAYIAKKKNGGRLDGRLTTRHTGENRCPDPSSLTF
jgi:hypothetical protein